MAKFICAPAYRGQASRQEQQLLVAVAVSLGRGLLSSYIAEGATSQQPHRLNSTGLCRNPILRDEMRCALNQRISVICGGAGSEKPGQCGVTGKAQM